jgi:rod shape determining protein RodA
MRRPVHDLTQPGWMIAGAVAILCLMGLACIYATESAGDGWASHTVKQTIFLVGSVLVTLMVLWIGYPRVSRYAYALFIVALALLVPLALAKGLHFDFGGLIPCRRGSYRWIKLPGFQLQPSEFVKVAYILALAWYLRYRRNYRTLVGMLVPFLLTMVPLALIVTEPDLGTAILMLPVPFVMLFVAGAKKRHLLTVALAGLVCAPLLWSKIQGYQRMRIVGLVLQSESLRSRVIADPDSYRYLCTPRQASTWPKESGLQLLRSKAALGSGGLFGQGWGHGTYVRYNFLPDRHNDMVFALVGHQWGLAGCLLVLACYAAIVVAGVEIASETAEPFARLLAVGVVALISAQAIINVGMTMGLMPITGMTLPFVSYGGSSLLTNFLAVGLLISVSQHRPFLLAKKPFEYGSAEDA